MKYFNVELLNAELARLTDRGAIPNKLKAYLLKFLEEYTLDESVLREAFLEQPLPPKDEYSFGKKSEYFAQ